MIVLRIKDKKAYYSLDGVNELGIKDISKEDILKILNLIYENDDIEFDSFVDNEISNPAERIIYEKLYEKLVEFSGNKESLKNEIDGLFKDYRDKYTQ